MLSFGGSKLLTAGRGGALLTRHAELHQRARVAIHRGNTVCPLSELQAAVLLPQLEQLAARNAARAANVARLRELLRACRGIRPFVNQTADDQPGYYKLGLQFDEAEFGLPRERFLAAVRAEGIAVDAGFRALHVGRSPRRFRQAGSLAEAERADRGTVVLHHPVLLGTAADVAEIAEAMEKVQAKAEQLRC